jgi:hypothetical protein
MSRPVGSAPPHRGAAADPEIPKQGETADPEFSKQVAAAERFVESLGLHVGEQVGRRGLTREQIEKDVTWVRQNNFSREEFYRGLELSDKRICGRLFSIRAKDLNKGFIWKIDKNGTFKITGFARTMPCNSEEGSPCFIDSMVCDKMDWFRINNPEDPGNTTAIGQISASIRKVGGDNPNVAVLHLRRSTAHGTIDVPLFVVTTGPKGHHRWSFVDYQGGLSEPSSPGVDPKAALTRWLKAHPGWKLADQ